MSSPNSPAFPSGAMNRSEGLTKREYAAIQIMAGMDRVDLENLGEKYAASYAILLADALFKQLEETEGEEE